MEKSPRKKFLSTGSFWSLLVGVILIIAIMPNTSVLTPALAASYNFSPYYTATGSSSYKVANSAALQLQMFSLSTWFKTSQVPSTYGFIANRGGLGKEVTGQNLNYGIWLTKTGQISAGFEDSRGTDYFATSASKYNDGMWHNAVVTFGGSTVYLYIDGKQVGSKKAQAIPDSSGTQSFTVGANSLFNDGYFVGYIDEVALYNRVLSATEITQLLSGSVSSTGKVLYLPFGTTSTTSSTSGSTSSTSTGSTSTGSTSSTSTDSTTTSSTSIAPTGYVVYISKTNSIISAVDSAGVVAYSGPSASAAIQAGIQLIKAKTAGGTVHINAGTYSITNTVSLDNANNIVVEGDSRDTTILQSGATGVKFFFKSSSTQTNNVVLRNIDIDGANISSKLLDFGNIVNLKIDRVILERHNESVPGVYLVDLRDSVIQNSILRNPNNVGDVIAITGTNVTFQYNDLTRQAARGGGITSGHLMNSKIINNNFHDFKGYAAISLENYDIVSGTYSFMNVEIAHNTFNNLDANAIHSLGYGPSGGAYYNLQIHDNSVQNATGHGIMLNAYDSQPNVVTYSSNIYNNVLLYTAGMSVGPLESTQISNNTIDHTANWRGYGIYLYPGSDNVTMIGNKISNTANAPYYFTGSTGISIDGVNVA